jgi:hypothetical protein
MRNSSKNITVLSKGERLGWEKISEQKKVPLRSVVSEGRKVYIPKGSERKRYMVP